MDTAENNFMKLFRYVEYEKRGEVTLIMVDAGSRLQLLLYPHKISDIVTPRDFRPYHIYFGWSFQKFSEVS